MNQKLSFFAAAFAGAFSLFAADFAGWLANGTASTIQTGRRPGASSLKIEMKDDNGRDNFWLGPVVKSTGKPMLLSFWAADNYILQPDATYAAVVDVIEYDKDGKEIRRTSGFRRIAWDDEEKHRAWGHALPETIKWKYYEAVFQPKGETETFRLFFHWPKTIVRGECYVSEFKITEAAPEDVIRLTNTDRAVKVTRETPFALELTSAAQANVFFTDDPLRFEALLYQTEKEDFQLKNPVIQWMVEDFEHNFIARGEASFVKAEPVADPAFYKSNPGLKRTKNLRMTLPVAGSAVLREPGRLFFLHAVLSDEGKVLAECDTLFMNAEPLTRPAKVNAFESRFIMRYGQTAFRDKLSGHEDVSLLAKNGGCLSSLAITDWKSMQPHYPGPYNFKEKLPSNHKILLTVSTEYERTSNDAMRKYVPPECLIDDPVKEKGHITFQIDPHVEFILAYVRHNRDAIAALLPTGTERVIDARTVELHKKVYTAVKKEFPDLPVGISLYGLPLNPSLDVDTFIKEDLFAYTDFINTHIYASSIDWTEWERLCREFKKRNLPLPFVTSTEYCRVTGTDQLLGCRSMIAAHLDAFAHRMRSIAYFNQCNESRRLDVPFLREPTELPGKNDMVSGFMYAQRMSWPRVSPEIEMTVKSPKWWLANWGWEYCGDTLFPLLRAAVYYNLVRNFDFSEYIGKSEAIRDVIAYQFRKDGKDVCAIWLLRAIPDKVLSLRTDVPFTLEDMYGRRQQITPVNGQALIGISQDPVFLLFEDKDDAFLKNLKETGITVSDSVLSAGGSGTLSVKGAADFGKSFSVSGTVDGTWPESGAAVRNENTVTIPVKLPADKAPGVYHYNVQLADQGKTFGSFRIPFSIGDTVTVSVDSLPLMKTGAPAVKVTLKNFSAQEVKGALTLEDNNFAESERPVSVTKECSIPANGQTDLLFPVPRDQVRISWDYPVTAVFRTGEKTFERKEKVSFRGVEPAPGKITIDGDLSDWKLENLTPVPMIRVKNPYGVWTWNGMQDCSCNLYALWDNDALYFAAVVKDDSAVVRFNDVDIWQDDNILLGLYPNGLKLGDVIQGGYYREHIGPCLDGTARIFRLGNPENGPAAAKNSQIAVKRTADGWIYEWCYSWGDVAPMQPVPGQKFRFCLLVGDRDMGKDGKPEPNAGGMALRGFCDNTDCRPDKWAEFTLTE